MKLKTALLQLLVFVCLPIKIHSQIAITNIAEIAKIKTGTTFFAMKDPASPKAAAYVDAIKKNWTFSKVECIKYSDVEKNIAPNNSFVTITANMTTSTSGANTVTHFYLELWTTDGSFVYDPKKRKHFNQEEKISIATVELFPDYITQDNPTTIYKMDYDASGHLKNWNAGVVGNYVQQLTILLNKGEARSTKAAFYNALELQKLSSETLYIPEYVMIKFVKNSDDESKQYEAKEVFEGLSLNCKLISPEALNDKILNSATPVYYLLLIKTTTEKFITVTNSKTGEIIYSDYASSSSNFKPSDLKDLEKAVKK
ncbi:MAG TPA: hypothetical protein PKN96_09245 [Flavobacterium sp.]|uniref:hypothetical protein n=1 Tax=Flavobacterium sp. TaxID=239 RepID=UPI002C16C6CA|nr:hypothetical protein [Flavobacterium sp.]HNP33465.1 hypothetical protein [Flavobacterium sp.]